MDPPGFVHSEAGSKRHPINISMTVDFRILQDMVDSQQLAHLCDEMDQCLQDRGTNVDEGRTHNSDRFKILNELETYPHTRSLVELIKHQAIPNTEPVTMVAFVRQHHSNMIHTDNNPNQGRGRTVLLPLRNIVEGVDRTVVFDHSTFVPPTQERISALAAQQRILEAQSQLPAMADHVSRYQLEHCGQVVNHLRVAGVFEYRLGDAVAFDAHALHASSDWNRHSPERTHKDYLLIHTTHRDGLTYRQSTLG